MNFESNGISAEDLGVTAEGMERSARHAVQMLFGGPEAWSQLASAHIKPQNVPQYLMLSLAKPQALEYSYMDTLREGVHAMVEIYIHQMQDWIKENGREDLTLTISERLELAMKSEQES